MGGGKPTVPENMMGTLTSSDHNFAHILNHTNIRHVYCAAATLGGYLEPLGPVNYIRIVAFSPNSLRAFFHGETIFIHYSTTITSLSLATHMETFYSSLTVLLQ